jgi:hypothetical protein
VSDDVELEEGHRIVAAGEELLYRQITKHMLTGDGQIGSHAFGAADSDAGKPSYARSSIVDAQSSRDWHDAHANSPSLGVWGVTVKEVSQIRRFVIDDSAAPLPAGKLRAPGHCFVDYRGLDRGTVKSLRGVLLRFALGRGEVSTTRTAADGELDL